jgi:hypothetical protein
MCREIIYLTYVILRTVLISHPAQSPRKRGEVTHMTSFLISPRLRWDKGGQQNGTVRLLLFRFLKKSCFTPDRLITRPYSKQRTDTLLISSKSCFDRDKNSCHFHCKSYKFQHLMFRLKYSKSYKDSLKPSNIAYFDRSQSYFHIQVKRTFLTTKKEENHYDVPASKTNCCVTCS